MMGKNTPKSYGMGLSPNCSGTQKRVNFPGVPNQETQYSSNINDGYLITWRKNGDICMKMTCQGLGGGRRKRLDQYELHFVFLEDAMWILSPAKSGTASVYRFGWNQAIGVWSDWRRKRSSWWASQWEPCWCSPPAGGLASQEGPTPPPLRNSPKFLSMKQQSEHVHNPTHTLAQITGGSRFLCHSQSQYSNHFIEEIWPQWTIYLSLIWV